MATHHSNDDAVRLSVDYDDRHDPLGGFPAPPEWTLAALCASTDPEAFFPEKGGSTREGKRICAGCPVQVECLDYALANEERFGIWGGVSERDRRRLTHLPRPHDNAIHEQQEPA